jgi:phosphoribosylaminoimidazolecarboxamide formyltransferase/IMP cyclohydrolase
VHAGILAREGVDNADLQRLGADFIDLVIVNLYPFGKTLESPDSRFEDLIENIDIGGPCMVRAAAKNHQRVAVVCDPSDYSTVASELKEAGALSPKTRTRLAAKAFRHTSEYDRAICDWLDTQVS